MLKKFIPELVGFVVGLCLAWYFQWKVADLVWSLWLGSLVVGYATILAVIGGSLWSGNEGVDWKKQEMTKGMAAGSGVRGALFMLVFFTFHFGMFHVVHAVFLNSFFPLEGFEGVKELFALFPGGLLVVIKKYGLWLLAAMVMEVRVIKECFESARALARGRTKNEKRGRLFTRPYANVIRMHLLIFVFAGFKAAGVDGFPVYAMVSVLYFFPWRLLGLGRSNTTSRSRSSE